MEIINISGSFYIVFLILSLAGTAFIYSFEKITGIWKKKEIMTVGAIYRIIIFSLLISLSVTFYVYIDQSICYEREIFDGSTHCHSALPHIALSNISRETDIIIFTVKIIALIFMALAFIKILYPLIETRKFMKEISRRSLTPSKKFSSLCRKINNKLKMNINFRVIDSPLMYPGMAGFFYPVIIIPGRIAEEFSEEELEALIYHEAGHIINKDNIMRLLILVCNSILFFLPLKDIYRKWDMERDLECDRLSAFYTGNPLNVASALLKTLKLSFKEKTFIYSTFANSKESAVRVRLKKLMEYHGESNFEKTLYSCCPKNFPTPISFRKAITVSLFLFFILIWSNALSILHCSMELLINI